MALYERQCNCYVHRYTISGSCLLAENAATRRATDMFSVWTLSYFVVIWKNKTEINDVNVNESSHGASNDGIIPLTNAPDVLLYRADGDVFGKASEYSLKWWKNIREATRLHEKHAQNVAEDECGRGRNSLPQEHLTNCQPSRAASALSISHTVTWRAEACLGSPCSDFRRVAAPYKL